MVSRPPKDRAKTVVVDPITGKPLIESKLNSLVIGEEVFPEEMEDEISGPDDSVIPQPVRSRTGVQFIGHISNPDDSDEVDALIAKFKDAWKARRKELGLD